MSKRVLVVDNYDSFVYILVQYLGTLGAEPIVVRNNALSLAELANIQPDGLVISPGPGLPSNAGSTLEILDEFAGTVPILGVCLGHQAIGQHFGGTVIRAPQLMHGKTSEIHHNGTGVFSGVESPITATRYHSLIVERDTLPAALEVTAETSDGTIMGLRHRDLDIEGVQFHPESVLSENGTELLSTFLTRCG